MSASETSKFRHLTAPYCQANGVDIGSGGDPVVPHAIAVDLPSPYTSVGDSPIHWRGDGLSLPFKDGTLGWVYCAVPGQRVLARSGWKAIEEIRQGDVIAGGSGWVRVEKASRFLYDGEIVSVASLQGRAVVTKNHPIATPSGWTYPDQLREGDQILAVPAEIQPSQACDRGHILRVVGGFASSRALGFPAPAKGVSLFAESNHQRGLLTLQNKVGEDGSKQIAAAFLASLNRDPVCHLGFNRRSGATYFSRIGASYASTIQDLGHMVQKNQTAIRDLDLRTRALPLQVNRSIRSDADAYASLAINDPSEPSPISVGRVHNRMILRYVGTVINLETSDGTFFLEGILTHNSSHLIEDFADWWPALTEWSRVLQSGGHLVILLPDKERWAAALARGQPPNLAHKHEGHVGELSTYCEKLGLEPPIIDDYAAPDDPNEYTLIFVARKK